MLLKYQIVIDNETFDLGDGSVKNWADIECSYKRSDYNGVIRSFASDFEFVGDIADRLKSLYLRDGVNALAHIVISAIDNNWNYNRVFSCDLDFSSINWDRDTLSISAIDNSLAAMIKSRKGTKYEFEVGTDIKGTQPLYYDRVEMLNTVEHTITGKESKDNGDVVLKLYSYPDNDALTPADSADRIEAYIMGDVETYEHSPFLALDQSTGEGACLLEAQEDCPLLTVKVEISTSMTKIRKTLEDDGALYDFDSIDMFLARCNSDNTYNGFDFDNKRVFSLTPQYIASREYVGTFDSLTALIDSNTLAPNRYAIVDDGSVSQVYYVPDTGFDPALQSDLQWTLGTANTFKFIRQYTFTDVRKGQKICLLTRTKARANIMGQLTYNSSKGCRECYFDARGYIKSMWASRGAPVEIPAISPIDVAQALLDKITENKYVTRVSISNNKPYAANAWIFAAESIRNISGAKLYTSFNEFCEWIEASFGYVYYLDESDPDVTYIRFVHRSELFRNDAPIVDLENATDIHYSVDNNLLYGTVEVGYSKQDYGKTCGRDEWNFLNTYTTGSTISDKKLSLKSPYRADCYGFEFLAQERLKTDKDNKSDNGVFVVLCRSARDAYGRLTIDRSPYVANVRFPGSVFNAHLSPLNCVDNNISYISAMGVPLTLNIASIDGKAVRINGTPIDSPRRTSNQIFSCGVLSFNSEEILKESDIDNTLIRVVDSNGTTYIGYISEMSMKYAREESCEYKLLVKRIEQ